MATGTAGIPNSTHSRAEPVRNRPTHPSRDRVPSGNTKRFQPSRISRVAVVVTRFPADRSIGKALKTSAVPADRHHTSKK
jgi:hypothetical protein